MALRALMQKYGPAAAISYSSVTLTFFSTISDASTLWTRLSMSADMHPLDRYFKPILPCFASALSPLRRMWAESLLCADHTEILHSAICLFAASATWPTRFCWSSFFSQDHAPRHPAANFVQVA